MQIVLMGEIFKTCICLLGKYGVINCLSKIQLEIQSAKHSLLV